MFRQNRRKDKEINIDKITELLIESRRGVLAVNGDDDYPYAIPINYFYDKDNQKIYFHSSCVGHKVDSLKKSNKVCFTVTGKEKIKDEVWAPYVQSVVVFGRCSKIADASEIEKRLKQFAMKYYPNENMADDEISKCNKAISMYEIEIEHITGKEIQEK